MTWGPVVCDLRAIQSPDHRGRGIARWSYELACAVEQHRPDMVGAYLLDPEWPPPGAADELVASGKLAYFGTASANAAIGRARAYHCFSPFEMARTIEQMRPVFVDHTGLGYSATVYDLIPLRRSAHYLSDPAVRRRYMARLEVLRSADALLAISGSAAADVRELLGIGGHRCHVVGTGVSRHFVPPVSREWALDDVRRAVPEIRGPFVVYTGGNEARKNIDGLVTAFGLLPRRLRDRFQLVVAGDLPPLTANHFRHLALQAGIESRLVLAGFVADELLVRLCQATSLMVFPSLAEGFGLPVAEALASGAVVAVSDRAPLDDLVPDRRARFDPDDPADMAETMARCLADESLQAAAAAAGGAAGAAVTRWPEVAGRAVTVWEGLVRRPRRPWTRRRRVAVVSPFPPLPTGVAGYSESLVLAMQRAADRRQAPGAPPVEIDCFADGRDRYPLPPAPIAGAVPRDARTFERVDGATGSYEHVLYVLGNSECHSNALGALHRRRGAVMAHDVRLSGLMAFSTETHGAVPGGLRGAIARNYPGLPPAPGRARWVSATDEDRYGLLLFREVLALTDIAIVSSEAAKRLAQLDAGPGLSDRIGVVPFAVSRLSAAERQVVDASRASSAGPARPPWQLASFGIVHPHKRPGVLVAALADLARRGVHAELALVGGVGDGLAAGLRDLARSLGVADRLRITGDVAWDRYLEELGRADLAIQLRHRFSGEASGTVSECLSAAVPTIVSAIGWMAEIPGDAVVHVPHGCSGAELADAVASMLATGASRRALGDAGRRWADTQTFDVAAEALLDTLGV